MRKPMATSQPSRIADQHEQHGADDGDGGVLAVQVGGGAFLDEAGDLLHALGAGVGPHNCRAGHVAVQQ